MKLSGCAWSKQKKSGFNFSILFVSCGSHFPMEISFFTFSSQSPVTSRISRFTLSLGRFSVCSYMWSNQWIDGRNEKEKRMQTSAGKSAINYSSSKREQSLLEFHFRYLWQSCSQRCIFESGILRWSLLVKQTRWAICSCFPNVFPKAIQRKNKKKGMEEIFNDLLMQCMHVLKWS